MTCITKVETSTEHKKLKDCAFFKKLICGFVLHKNWLQFYQCLENQARKKKAYCRDVRLFQEAFVTKRIATLQKLQGRKICNSKEIFCNYNRMFLFCVNIFFAMKRLTVSYRRAVLLCVTDYSGQNLFTNINTPKNLQ